ncbi:hypothetical protein KY289_018276 [Solanum tuberosum]|nr:hypothetical protein KY289_018276 [Solanum tuberosum]
MNFLYPVEDYGVAISVAAEQSFKGNRCMTPVSHQFGISSCVPFVVCDAVSAVSALEVPGHLPWKAIPLSKQELVDCVPVDRKGVHFERVYKYVIQRGLHSEFNYPYRAQYGLPCLCFPLLEKHKVGILGYEPLLSDAAVIDALDNAPVTATICVYESFLNRGRTIVSI